MKYYQINVTMKTGFKYSYTCIGKLLEGMKASSQGYWTEKIEVVEISEEEHRGQYIFVDEKTKVVQKSKPKEPAPEKKSVAKKGTPKFSSLENFFDSSEGAPENKKLKKRV